MKLLLGGFSWRFGEHFGFWWRQLHVPESATANIKRLPEWVKCVYCGGKPTKTDFLGELIRYSNALAHQSCAKQRGKVFGMNAGTIQEIDGKVKAVE